MDVISPGLNGTRDHALVGLALVRAGRRVGAAAPALGGRDVDLGRVGVAAAQRAGASQVPGEMPGSTRRDSSLTPIGRARADHVGACACAGSRPRSCSSTPGGPAPVLGMSQRAGSRRRAAARARRPRGPLKTSRLRAFQYSGSARTTRMTSLPSRGQVDRPVALVHEKRTGSSGPEALGERAVVEPRLAAVGGRRDRQRARAARPRAAPATPEPGPQRQPLQPQEARRVSAASAEPEQQRGAVPPSETTGEATTTSSTRERDERVAAIGRRQRHARAGPRRARPERQQPGEDQQLGAEQLEHDPRPRVARSRTGSRTVPSACRPPPSPDNSSSQCRAAEAAEAGAREPVAERTARRTRHGAAARAPRSRRGGQRARTPAPPPPAADRDEHPQQRPRRTQSPPTAAATRSAPSARPARRARRGAPPTAAAARACAVAS